MLFPRLHLRHSSLWKLCSAVSDCKRSSCSWTHVRSKRAVKCGVMHGGCKAKPTADGGAGASDHRERHSWKIPRYDDGGTASVGQLIPEDRAGEGRRTIVFPMDAFNPTILHFSKINCSGIDVFVLLQATTTSSRHVNHDVHLCCKLSVRRFPLLPGRSGIPEVGASYPRAPGEERIPRSHHDILPVMVTSDRCTPLYRRGLPMAEMILRPTIRSQGRHFRDCYLSNLACLKEWGRNDM